jgi:putative transposase
LGHRDLSSGLEAVLRDRKAQAQGARAQRNHLGLALGAFLRLEANRLENGASWYEAKISIVRDAVRRYLAEPLYLLSPTA